MSLSCCSQAKPRNWRTLTCRAGIIRFMTVDGIPADPVVTLQAPLVADTAEGADPVGCRGWLHLGTPGPEG